MGWSSLALCQCPWTSVSLASHCPDPTTFPGSRVSQHFRAPSLQSKTSSLHFLFYPGGSGPCEAAPGHIHAIFSSRPLLSRFLRSRCSGTVINTAISRRLAIVFAMPGKAESKPMPSEFLSAGRHHSFTPECWPQSGGQGTDPHMC